VRYFKISLVSIVCYSAAVLVFGSLLCLYSCDIPKRPLNFPFDHGPHFNAINEWWYFTGIVQTSEQRILGYEFTIFKRPTASLKGFAYLGHLAISNPQTAQHLFEEAATPPPVSGIVEGLPKIIVNNFSYQYSESGEIRLAAETKKISVDLTLSPVLDIVFHGGDGIIVMGDGKSSYYYSLANLTTTGTLSINGEQFTLSSGRSWMDHQWGNFTVLGMRWDWLSLRFNDGGSLMLFQFRDISDRVIEKNWSYQAADGAVTYGEEFWVQAHRLYKEQQGRSVYPLDWTVEVPALNAVFQVTPLFDAQSLYNVMTPDYWEGICSLSGIQDGKPVSGSAYVELTGYECGNPLW